MPDEKLLLLARDAREHAEQLLARAETFHDPEVKRLIRQLAAGYEEAARWIERKANDADKA